MNSPKMLHTVIRLNMAVHLVGGVVISIYLSVAPVPACAVVATSTVGIKVSTLMFVDNKEGEGGR